MLRDCSAALELNPRYTKALQRRARAAEFLQDLDLALEDYTAICIIETFNNPESLTVVDRLLKQIGQMCNGRCSYISTFYFKISIESFTIIV